MRRMNVIQGQKRGIVSSLLVCIQLYIGQLYHVRWKQDYFNVFGEWFKEMYVSAK